VAVVVVRRHGSEGNPPYVDELEIERSPEPARVVELGSDDE